MRLHGRMLSHFRAAVIKVMQLTVNGAPHSFKQNSNLSQLLETLNLTEKRLAGGK
jgi:sulfur carrier protein